MADAVKVIQAPTFSGPFSVKGTRQPRFERSLIRLARDIAEAFSNPAKRVFPVCGARTRYLSRKAEGRSADLHNAVASTESQGEAIHRGIDMPVIVKERVDPKPASTSNRVRVIVLLLSIACAGAFFASFFLPAESIVPATEGQWAP